MSGVIGENLLKSSTTDIIRMQISERSVYIKNLSDALQKLASDDHRYEQYLKHLKYATELQAAVESRRVNASLEPEELGNAVLELRKVLRSDPEVDPITYAVAVDWQDQVQNNLALHMQRLQRSYTREISPLLETKNWTELKETLNNIFAAFIENVSENPHLPGKNETGISLWYAFEFGFSRYEGSDKKQFVEELAKEIIKNTEMLEKIAPYVLQPWVKALILNGLSGEYNQQLSSIYIAAVINNQHGVDTKDLKNSIDGINEFIAHWDFDQSDPKMLSNFRKILRIAFDWQREYIDTLNSADLEAYNFKMFYARNVLLRPDNSKRDQMLVAHFMKVADLLQQRYNLLNGGKQREFPQAPSARFKYTETRRRFQHSIDSPREQTQQYPRAPVSYDKPNKLYRDDKMPKKNAPPSGGAVPPSIKPTVS